MSSAGYAQYRKVTTQTAGPGDLLIQLYQGAIRFAGRGSAAIERNDPAGAHTNIVRVQDIVTELQRTLNHEVGGEIARQLDQIYTYMLTRLLAANVQKDREPLDEVAELLRQLLSAWQVAVRETARQSVPGAQAAIATDTPLRLSA